MPITFAAGTKGPIKVKVTTITNLISEPTETFKLEAAHFRCGARVGNRNDRRAATTTPPPTTPTTQPQGGPCPTGSTPTTALPSAPSSPSSPATLIPPAE